MPSNRVKRGMLAYLVRLPLFFVLFILLSSPLFAHEKITKEDVLKWIEENSADELSLQTERQWKNPITGHAIQPTNDDSVPSVHFSANGVEGNSGDTLIARVGESITYKWSIENAPYVQSFVYLPYSDGCGNPGWYDYSEDLPWMVDKNTERISSRTDVVAPCQEGATYYIVIYAYSSDPTSPNFDGEFDYSEILIRIAGSNDITETITCKFPGSNPDDYNYCYAANTNEDGPRDDLYGDMYCVAPMDSPEQCSFTIGGPSGTKYSLHSPCGKSEDYTLDGIPTENKYICPSASLLANGGSEVLARVGDQITYSWSAKNAQSASSFYMLDEDACGADSNEVHPWLADTLEGSRTDTVAECQKGRTYVLFYMATKAEGNQNGPLDAYSHPVFVKIEDPKTSVRASITSGGEHYITVQPGSTISYEWESANADTWYSTVESDERDSCATSSQERYSANSSKGSASHTIEACEEGRTYTISYHAKNQNRWCWLFCGEEYASDTLVIRVSNSIQEQIRGGGPDGPSQSSQYVRQSPSPSHSTSPSQEYRSSTPSASPSQTPSPQATPSTQQETTPSSGQETPTATLRAIAYGASGQFDTTDGDGKIVLSVGDRVKFEWSSNAATDSDASSTYMIEGTLPSCDKSGAGPHQGVASGKSGSRFDDTIQSCQAARSYRYTYEARKGGQSAQSTIVIEVNSASAPASTPSTTPASSSSANLAPIGHFDLANCDTISGWACDKDAPNQPISLHLYKGGSAGVGQYVETITANQQREASVGSSCADSGAHGFSIPTPTSLKNGAAQTLYIHAINTPSGDNPVISGSGKSITCGSSQSTTPSSATPSYRSIDSSKEATLGVKNLATGEMTSATNDIIEVSPGQEIEFAWSSTIGNSYDNFIVTDKPQPCVLGIYPNGILPGKTDGIRPGMTLSWIGHPQTDKGSKKYTVKSCDAGATYRFSYSAHGGRDGPEGDPIKYGDTVTIVVAGDNSNTRPFTTMLRAKNVQSGQSGTSITANPGDQIDFSWSTNMVDISASYSSTNPSACVFNLGGTGSTTRGQSWNDAKSARGTKRYTVQSCDRGANYTFNYRGTDYGPEGNAINYDSWVTISIPESSSTSAPTATLHAVALRNNQQIDTTDGDGTIDVLPGDSVRYTWSSTNADSTLSWFTVNDGASGRTPWLASSTSGSRTDVVGANQAQTTYTISLTGMKNNQQSSPSTITVRVGTPQAGVPTATLRAVALRNGAQVDTTDGDGEIRVITGDRIRYEWSSTNAQTFRSTFSTNLAACGIGVGPNPWGIPNSASGSNDVGIIADCQAARTYTLLYYAKNNASNQESSSSIRVVVAQAPTATLTAANLRISTQAFSSISTVPGDQVRYSWSSSNADQFSSIYSVNQPACGTSGTGPYSWGVATGASGSDSSGTIQNCQAGRTYTLTYIAKNSTTGQEARAIATVLVEAFNKVGCENNVCWGSHSYVFPVRNAYGMQNPYPAFCKAGYTIDVRNGKWESTCESGWQVQSGCTTVDGYTFPNCPAPAQSRSNAQCVREYCQGFNSRVYPVENGNGQSNGNQAYICDGQWWIDSRGSSWSSNCATGWRAG